MAPRNFNYNRHYQLIGELLRPLDVESSLLFCNHVLAAIRGDDCSPHISDYVRHNPLPIRPFLVHFAAKQILVQSLGPTNRAMGIAEFNRLIELLWNIYDHDPAMRDSGWAQSDPTGTLMRFTAPQQPLMRMPLQHYGLATALFTNNMIRQNNEHIDVPSRLQDILGMAPHAFMHIGFVAGSIRACGTAGTLLRSTISADYIKRHTQEIGTVTATYWQRFISLTACTIEDFKKLSRNSAVSTNDIRYRLYDFNLIKRYPFIDIGKNRYISIDPELVYARTSLGMYFDALEVDGVSFTDAFGNRFANLVGDLARTSCGADNVWSDSDITQHIRANPPSKYADHAVCGSDSTVLVECKAMRPSNKVMMMGNPEIADTIISRVAGAVIQLTEHSTSIQADQWTKWGLPPKKCYGVVVTYGPILLANTVFF